MCLRSTRVLGLGATTVLASGARWRRITFVALSAAMVAALAAASSAFANAPVRQPLPNPPGTITGFCSFPINVTFPVNNEYTKTWSDAAGNPVRVQVEGHLVATMTNANTGKTVTENISGPGEIDYLPDGTQTVTFLGNGAVFVLQNGNPVLELTQGRVVIAASSPTALGTVLSAVGRATNVCDLLS